ncbi:deoxyhypusine synthase family protein [Pyxidicoccus parkwayensis]|uniref:Deoxyhypusine synthase family protein n=1 Tax=Pyxidicoccus parkwayensis TaxID=2813578 RepID=A0ABX7P8P3_9BACT|nr:deoxyhypusine synthase family protein [Pyxidicoccus parkwaysis]
MRSVPGAHEPALPTTRYGSYSGAVPNEKSTWGKLGVGTPKHVVERDASIVAPLVFGDVLDV